MVEIVKLQETVEQVSMACVCENVFVFSMLPYCILLVFVTPDFFGYYWLPMKNK